MASVAGNTISMAIEIASMTKIIRKVPKRPSSRGTNGAMQSTASGNIAPLSPITNGL